MEKGSRRRAGSCAAEMVGVESLADGLASVRVKFKTLPLNQVKVGNELRRRLMIAFVARGIKPYG